MDAILVLKIALAPALILGASMAGDRWGNTVSGWFVGLPLTSAPVIFLLALERGVDFASVSALGTTLGIVSLSAFSLTYAWLSLRLRLGWPYAIAAGWGVFFLSSLILEVVSVPLIIAFTGVSAWLVLVAKLFPLAPESMGKQNHRSGRWDVAARLAAAISLVFLITENAPFLGPRLSGLLTPFPIYTSVLAVAIHRSQGAAQAVKFTRGATVSLFTPAMFFLIVGTTITSQGVGVAYVLAISVSLIVHWLVLRVLRGTAKTQ